MTTRLESALRLDEGIPSHEPLSGVQPKERARHRLLEDLRAARTRALEFVGGSIGADGRVRGGCGGRPLETAIALHTFTRDLEGSLPARDRSTTCARLLSYCQQYWDKHEDWRPTGCAADVDEGLAHAFVAKVLDECPPESTPYRIIHRTIDGFLHPSTARKRTLFSILFAELGIIPYTRLDLDLDVFEMPQYHLFAQLGMTAAKVLYCHATNRAPIEERDIDFLVRSQLPNGGWENHVLVSIMALITLTKVQRHPDTVARGVDFVLRQIREDGGVPFISDEDVWLTCLAGFVLTRADPSNPCLPAMAGYIASQQQPRGGWCYSEGIKTDDADDISVSLAFLSSYDPERYAGHIARGRARLLDLQNDDGGFSTFIRGAASEVELTAKSITALSFNAGRGSAFAVPFSPRELEGPIERALLWISDNQRSNGSFQAEWKLSVTYPLAHVMVALRSLRFPGGIAEDIARRTADHARNIQSDDGGWSPLPGSKPTSVLSTAYALITLCSAERQDDLAAITRGARYLLDLQEETGEFRSLPDSLGPRPVVYNVKLLSTIYTIWALTEVIEALAGASSRPPS